MAARPIGEERVMPFTLQQVTADGALKVLFVSPTVIKYSKFYSIKAQRLIGGPKLLAHCYRFGR